MAPHSSHRSSWSDADVEALRKGLADGIAARELARALGRTEEAVRRKARLLAVPKSGSPSDYHRKRAAEERRRAREATDPAVAAIHEQMANYYQEVIEGDRQPLSPEAR